MACVDNVHAAHWTTYSMCEYGTTAAVYYCQIALYCTVLSALHNRVRRAQVCMCCVRFGSTATYAVHHTEPILLKLASVNATSTS
jgi:hypothetical protein